MAFDKTKPYGESLGGATHGWFVQDDLIWHPSGEYAVDQDGNKLPAQKSSKAAKQDAKPAEQEEGVLANELKD